MDDSAIIHDEIINVKETDFNEETVTCKTQNFYILIVFLLLTIALLIAVSIYCYMIKDWGKHLLPFHDASNKLNKFYIDGINWKRVI